LAPPTDNVADMTSSPSNSVLLLSLMRCCCITPNPNPGFRGCPKRRYYHASGVAPEDDIFRCYLSVWAMGGWRVTGG
jgi:hypothetical protein